MFFLGQMLLWQVENHALGFQFPSEQMGTLCSFLMDLAPCSPGKVLVAVSVFTSTAPVPASPPTPGQPSFSSNL